MLKTWTCNAECRMQNAECRIVTVKIFDTVGTGLALSAEKSV